MVIAVLWFQFTMNAISLGISDPGYILEGDELDCESMKFCGTGVASHWQLVNCNMNVPEDAYHCMDCNICVSDYDHHCSLVRVLWVLGVWIGKCIGRNNMLQFNRFCVSLVISFFYLAFCQFLTFFNVFSITIWIVWFTKLGSFFVFPHEPCR